MGRAFQAEGCQRSVWRQRKNSTYKNAIILRKGNAEFHAREREIFGDSKTRETSSKTQLLFETGNEFHKPAPLTFVQRFHFVHDFLFDSFDRASLIVKIYQEENLLSDLDAREWFEKRQNEVRKAVDAV